MSLSNKWIARGGKLLKAGPVGLKSLLIGILDYTDSRGALRSQCTGAFADMCQADIEDVGREIVSPLLHELLRAMGMEKAGTFLETFDSFRAATRGGEVEYADSEDHANGRVCSQAAAEPYLDLLRSQYAGAGILVGRRQAAELRSHLGFMPAMLTWKAQVKIFEAPSEADCVRTVR